MPLFDSPKVRIHLTTNQWFPLSEIRWIAQIPREKSEGDMPPFAAINHPWVVVWHPLSNLDAATFYDGRPNPPIVLFHD